MKQPLLFEIVRGKVNTTGFAFIYKERSYFGSAAVKLLMFYFLLQIFSNQSSLAASLTWANGSAGGAWTAASNWSPAQIPAANDDIIINPTATITITAVPTIALNSMTIGGTGNAILQSGAAVSVTINNGAAPTDFSVAAGATLTLDNSVTILNNVASSTGVINGTVIATGAGTLTGAIATTTFAAGSIYTHNRDGGVFPVATWNSTSTCNVTGVITTAPTGAGLAGGFGIFNWNCPAQMVAVNMGYPITTSTITSNFTVTNTNTGTLSLCSNTTTAGTIINMSGDLSVLAGTFYINTSTAVVTLNVTGNCNVTGGLFNFTTSSGIHLVNINGNLTVSGSGTLNYGTSGGANLSVKGNVTNNGIINSNTSASNVLTMNGTAAQTISGTGTWISNIAGALKGLTINNTSGANPAVDLQTNLILEGSSTAGVGLTLTSGILGSTNASTLTIGTGVSTTFTANRTNGSIAGSLTIVFNLTNVIYNLTYGTASSVITTGGELPPSSYNNYILGLVTCSNPTANGGVKLGADANVNSITITSGAYQLDLNGKVLKIFGVYTNSGTPSPSGLIGNASGSTLHFNGVSAQSFTVGVYTSSLLSNLVVSNMNAAGVSIAATVNIGTITVNTGAYLQVGSITVNITGDITNNGTIMASGASTAAMINMNGTSAQTISGTGQWMQITTNPGMGLFPGLGINNAAGVTLDQSIALQNILNLDAGVLSGSGTLTLGNGTASTLNARVGTGATAGGSIFAGMTVAYNLALATFNLTYNILSPAAGYTTGKELPSLAATPPTAGTVTISNTHASGVTLGNDATVFSFTISGVGTVCHLNGKNLRIKGALTNSATGTGGLNSSVAGSKLTAIGLTQQAFNYGNQTFSSVITRPDLDVYNTGLYPSPGVYNNSLVSLNNVTVYPGGMWYVYGIGGLVNVFGNITNNGSIFADASSVTAIINMNGSAVQTISGTGTWFIGGTTATGGPGANRFPGLGILNTSGSNPAVILNQSFSLQNTLNLTQGILGTTNGSTLTLGTGVSGATLAITVGTGATPGGSIASSLNVNYNLTLMTYNVTYNILSPAAGYTTGKELAPLSATPPAAGTVTIANTHASGVTLSDDVTAFGFTINLSTILHLNGKTLRLAGNFLNSATAANTGLNATPVSGNPGKLLFIGAGPTQQGITFGNQTFSSVVTAPDMEVSNIFYNGGTSASAAVQTTASGNVRHLTVNPSSYLFFVNVNLNVSGNLVNNGLIYTNGSNTSSLITMNGAAAQTISGTGAWQQVATNPGAGWFPGLGINNTSGATPAVSLNQNLILQNQLLLSAGQLGGSGTLTLGNATTASVLTINVGVVGGTTAGGIIDPAMNVAYNLPNMTLTMNYYPLTPAGGYTTGKELPSLAAVPPAAGVVTIVNTNAAGITLGNDATVFSLTNNLSAILHLSGKTLRLAGTFLNSATAANTGLNSSVAGSKLSFIGTVLQNITLNNQTFSSVVTAPDIEVSNTFFNNASSSAAAIAAAGTVKNITINSGSYLQISGNVTVNVTENITNNGLFFATGSNTSTILNFNGTSAQTISGTGGWSQVGAPAGNGMFTGFLIANASGVVLNQNVALQNRLDLLTSGGVLSGSGILTLGNGASGQTLTVNRSFGSLNMTNPVLFNLPGVTYNLNYNTTAAATPITTGGELPPSSYDLYKLGTLTVNTTAANGGVILSRSSSTAILSMATATLLDLDVYTLRIYGTQTMTGTATIDATDATAKLSFIGVAAQTLTGTMAANYTSNYIANIEVNNPAGLTLPATQIGNASVNGTLTMTLGTLTIPNTNPALTIWGTVSSTPVSTLSTTSPFTTTGIVLRGSSGNMGNINLSGYLSGTPQTIGTLDVNITGVTPQVTINGNLTIGTTFILTSGVVNMGQYAVNYTNTSVLAGTSMLPATQSTWSGYFAFNGASSGLTWTMNSVAAGTYRWPVGTAVSTGWRPVTIQTLAPAAAATSVRIGYVGPISGAGYSASDISSSDIRSNYIANLSLQGNIGTPNITMEYQDADFNTTPSAASAVNIWYYNIPSGAGTSIWTSTGTQDANGTNGANTTIVKNGAIALTSGKIYPLNLAETNSDVGTSTTTYIWNGVTSTAWATGTNWTPAGPPSAGANIIIPDVANDPIIATGASISVNDISIVSGAFLTLDGTASLTVSGDFINQSFNLGQGPATTTPFNGLRYTTTGSTVTYTGTSKLIAPGFYYNLTFSGATTPVLSPVGTIAIANTFAPGSAVATNTGSTILFNGASQTSLPAFAYYNNVIFGSTGTTHTLAGAITVAGDMTINTTTFNDGGFLITGPGLASGKTWNFLPKGTGRTYNATYTGGKAIPDFQYYDIYGTDAVPNTLNLNGAITASQTIPAAMYGIVNINNGTTFKKTLAGDATFRGLFTVTTGGFDDGGYILTLIRGLTNNAATPTNGGITSTGSGKILFAGGVAAHAISSTAAATSFGNMELNDGNGATFTDVTTAAAVTMGSLTVTSGLFTINDFGSITTVGTLTISSTATIGTQGSVSIPATRGNTVISGVFTNNGSFSVTGTSRPVTYGSDLENNGLFSVTTGGVNTFSGATKEIKGTNYVSIPTVAMSGTYTNKLTGTYTLPNAGTNFIATGGFRVTSSWAAGAGTLTQGTGALFINSAATITPSLDASATGNTVVYNGSTSTIKTPIGTGGHYYNLILNQLTAVAYSLTAASTVTIDNNLTFYPSIAGATFADAASLLVGPGAGMGTFDMSSPFTSTLTLTNTSLTPNSPFPSFGTYLTTPNNTVNFTAAVAQDLVSSSVTSVTFGNLGIVGAGVKTAKQAVLVKGNLAIGGGGLADNGNTITVNGNVSGTVAHTSTGGGSITLSGGSIPHSLSNTGNYGNLTLDDAQGAVVSGATAFNITGALGLKQGIFMLGTGITTLSGTVTYPSPGTGTIAGNLPILSTSSLTIAGTTGGSIGTLNFAPANQNIGTLTMSRTGTAGRVELGTPLLVNTSLTWSAANTGKILLGNNDLTVGSGGTITTTFASVNAMVVADTAYGTGKLRKTFVVGTATTVTFPVGDSTGTTEYSPFVLTAFTALGSNRTIGVYLNDDAHFALNSNAAQSNYITRYWKLSDDGAGTGYTYTGVTLNYLAADGVGTLNATNDQVNRFDNGTTAWNIIQPTASLTTTAATATLAVFPFFGQSSGTLGNNDLTVRNNPAQGAYTWLPTTGSADWNLATNWSPSRFSPAVSDTLKFSSGGTSIALNVPTQTVAKIEVSNTTNISLQAALSGGNTLSINGATAMTNLSVESGSTLQISTATISLGAMTLNYGAVTGQLANIAGTMIAQPNGTYTATNSTTTFTSTGTYQHNRDAGTIPTATWAAASTLNVTGVTSATSIVAATGNNYGNIIWNSPGIGTFAATSTVNGDLTVSQGTVSLNTFAITIAGNSVTPTPGNVTNNGIINTAGASAAGLNMQSTNGAQTIDGAGLWIGNTVGSIFNLSINNTDGVDLKNSFAVYGTLTLTKGALSSSDASTLTFGNGTAITVTTTITNGSLGAGLLTAFNILGATYNVNYNATAPAATQTTGIELPPLSYTNYRAGTVTINNPTTSGGVILGQDAAINSYAMGASSKFDMNGKTLNLFGNFTTSAATTTLTANDPASTLNFYGNAAQSLSYIAGTTLTGNVISNVNVNNTHPTSGLSLSALISAPNSVGNVTISSGSYLNLNSFNLNVSGNFTNNGTLISATAGSTLTMGGSSAQTISGSGVWTTTVGANNGLLLNHVINNAAGVAVNCNYAIQTALTITNGLLSGSGTMTLGNGATSTLAVIVTTASTPTLAFAFNLTNVTANYTYNGTATQTTGPELAASINTITINNSTGVNLNSNLVVNAATGITFTAGRLSIGSNNFTYASTSTTTGTPTATAYFVTDGAGQVKKIFPSGAPPAFTFPIGDNSGITPNNAGPDYSPVTLTFTANSIQRTIGIRVTDSQHPNDLTSNNYISRYWSYTDDQAGTYTYTLSANYSTAPTSDLVGTHASAVVNRWNGSTWTEYATTGTAPTHTITGFTETSAPLNGSVFTARVNPSNTYTWDGSVNSDWQVAANWTPDRVAPFSSDILIFNDGGTWTITNVPAQTVGRILVTDNGVTGTNISLQAAATSTLTLGYISGPVNALTIDGTSGMESTLQLSSTGAVVHTLAFGNTQAFSTSIAGNFIVNANTAQTNNVTFANLLAANNIITGTVTNNGGAVTAITTNTTFGAVSTYVHNRDGGIIPAATWDAASLCKITGASATSPTTFSSITLGKFTWDCAGQGATTLSLGTTAITFNGDFKVVNTGAGALTFNNTTSNVTMNGDFLMQGGTLSLNLHTTTPITTINLLGNFNQSGGTINRGTNTGTNLIHFNGTSKTITQSSGTINGTGITIDVASGAIYSLSSNFDIATAGQFTVNGRLNCGTFKATGAAAFSLVAAGTLSMDDPDGITTSGATGNIQVTGTRTYTAGANYIYNSGCTSTGNGFGSTTALTAVFNNATINLTVPVTITGTTGALQLTGALLSLGNNDLTLNSTTATITGAANDASNMIVTNGTGQLKKLYPALVSSFTFPVGEVSGTAEYSPVTLAFSANSLGTRIVGFGVVDARHPNDIPTNPDYLTRYWPMSCSIVTGTWTISSATFTYLPADVVGTEANLLINQYNPATTIWTQHSSSVSSPVLTLNAASNPNFLIAASDITGRNNISTVYYRSRQNGNWNDVNTWEVSTDPAFLSPVPQTATIVPNDGNSNSIQIQGGDTVTVTAAQSADDFTIDATGQLTVNSGIIFTVANGAAAVDMTANGYVLNNGTVTATGAITVGSTGTFEYATNGGTVPSITWTTGSLCLISSAVSAPTLATTQTYSNFTLTMGVSLSTSFVGATTVGGNLTVTSGTLNFSTSVCTVSGTTIISGSLSSPSGTKNLTGDVIINSGGIWTNTTGTINMSGNLQNDGTFNSGTGTYNFNGSAKSFTGSVAALNFAGPVTITSPGDYTIAGSIANLTIVGALSGSGSLTMGTGTTLTLGSNNTITTLNCTANTPNLVVYNSTTAVQTVKGTAYYDLEINKAGQIGTLGAAATINNNLTVTAGTFSDGSFQITGNATGVLTVSAVGTLQIASAATATTFPTLFTFANISLVSGSTVIYGSTSGAQTVSSIPAYSNLTIQGGAVKTANGSITVNGNLTITAGTLADGGFQIVGNAGGTLNMTAGTLTLGTTTAATALPTFGTYTLAAASIVNYNSNVAQNISNAPSQYGALTTTATAAVTKTLQGNITVTGAFTNGTNNTFDMSGFTLNLAGSYVNSGTLMGNAVSSTLHFNGSVAQTLSIGSYTGNLLANLVCSNTNLAGLGISTTVNVGNLTVNASGLLVNSNVNVNVANDLTNNGTISAAGTSTSAMFTMNGSVVQAISGTGVWQLTTTDAGTGRFNGLGINNTSGSSPAVNLNMNLALRNAINLTNGILGGSGILTFGLGGVVNTFTMTRVSGSLASAPAFNLINLTFNSVYGNGTSVPAVTTGVEMPYSPTAINNFTINNPTNGVILGDSIRLGTAGVLTLTNGNIDLGNYNFTITNTATAAVSGGSATSFVKADGTGQLIRHLPTIASLTTYAFPVGDVSGTSPNNTGSDYSPVSLGFTANSTARAIGIRVTDGQHPNDLTTGNYISRYWSYTDDEYGVGTYTYNATYTYSVNPTSDLVGSQTSMFLNRWDGSQWAPQLIPSAFPTNGMTVTGATETTGTLGNNSFTGRIDPPKSYTWIATSGTGDWNTASNWTPSRTSSFVTDWLYFTNGGTPTADNVPTQTIGKLIIDTTTDATLTQATGASTLSIRGVAADTSLRIGSGSTLNLTGGTGVLTLTFTNTSGQIADISGSLFLNSDATFSSSIATTTVNVPGNITLNAATSTFVATNTITSVTGSITRNGSTITSTAANLIFGAASFYNHNVDAGVVPTATWDAASTCNIASPTSGPTSGLAQTLGNLTINMGTGTTSLTGTTTIAGTLTLTNGILDVNTRTLNLNGPNVSGTVSNLSTTTSSIIGFGGSNSGIFVPTSITNIGRLTLSNPNGIFLAADLTVNLTTGLTLTSGLLYLGNFNLIYAATSTTTAGGPPSASNMVVADATLGTGQVIKNFPAGASSFTFPIGDGGGNYSSASLTFVANTDPGTVGVNVTDADDPNINTPSVPGAWLSRYWTFTNTGLTTYGYTATLRYPSADINGLETDLRYARWNGSSWDEQSGSNAGSNVLTVTASLNETSYLLSGNVTGRNTTPCVPATVTALANGSPSISVCNGSAVTLAATPSGGSGCTGALEYSWQDGNTGLYWNGSTFASVTPMFNASYNSITYSATSSASPSTTYTATVRCSNSTLCYNTATTDVTVNPGILIVSPSSATIFNGGNVDLTAAATSLNVGPITYTWAPATGLSSTTGATVNAAPTSSTTYTVTATDNGGCSISNIAAVNVSNGYSVSCSHLFNNGVTITGMTLWSGPTISAAADSNVVMGLPFQFKFNGTYYSQLGFNTNGFAWVGNTPPPANTYAPISSNASVDGIISIFGRQLVPNQYGTSQIVYGFTGAAPNRYAVIAWQGYQMDTGFPLTDTLWFTMRIYEDTVGSTTPSRISFEYRSQDCQFILGQTGAIQIGLRGATNADFNNRNITGNLAYNNWGTAGTSNTSSLNWFNNYIAAFGSCGNSFLRYWDPVNTGSATITPSGSVSVSCPTTSVLLTSSSSASYQWFRNGTYIPGATSQTYTATLNGNYQALTACGGVSAATAVTIGPCCSNPTALNTTAVSPSCIGGSNGSASVTAVGGSPTPFSYLWSNGATDQAIVSLTAGTYTVTVTTATGGCNASATVIVSDPILLGASCGGTNISCFGAGNGTASVTAVNGSSPFTYLWDNGATNSSITSLLAGTYSVTISDNCGSSASCSFTVVEPSALSASCSGTNVSCNGGSNGSVSVIAAGGTPAYSYLWSNGATSASVSALSAANYSVTVTDASGCTAICSYTVTQPLVLSISCGGTQVSCNGAGNGTAAVTANGGSPGYSYSWSNSATTSAITGLSPGSYSVTVTDVNSCSASCSFTITQPSALTISAGNDSPVCAGNDVNLTSSVSGGTVSYGYSWTGPNSFSSTDPNPLIAAAPFANNGTYTLIVTDGNGCIATTTTAVTINICTTTLNLNLFIEGYYIGGGQMQPVILNENVVGATGAETDTIFVQLRQVGNPTILIESIPAVLMTDGTASAIFSGSIAGNTYWIAVYHRNTVATWSSAPFAFSLTPVSSYDFASAQSNAYGSNQILMDNSPVVWAFYNGDITQDENVDLLDFPDMDFGINNGLFGYYSADLNGDGNVDLLDFPILDANINMGIFSFHP